VKQTVMLKEKKLRMQVNEKFGDISSADEDK
jgi:hypothetical protein